MKPVLLAALALTLLPSGPVLARGHSQDDVQIGDIHCCDAPVRWGPRYDTGDSRIAITNEERKVTLLLTDDVVAFQLSNRVMHKVDRELHHARYEDDDDGAIGDAIKSAVIGAVRSLLHHSAECPVRELRDVRYEHGRLVFVTRDGDRAFERLDVDHEDVLETFDAGDARAFVREFRRLRASR